MTNRGRQFESRTNDCSEMQSLAIVEGSTITGFYGNKDLEYGLIGLGVISELL
ncbi:hypothetical protein K431DRAFT_282790 [Polychaeton citri CBS 116435]|uniref:Uncharacterized protein n=1 Tax=Polychaeton citri CBS 116435 TaxID=1314669 RepID=A0A9P4QF47_9PEZI|nr:hypothetical protein K431DRAFT_282790 [Polychaeton citri CBS 116435]